MAKGTPVVVSDLGAPAELINDGRLGFHFRAGDASSLAEVMEEAFSCCTGAMRRRARNEYESRYTGEENHQMLMTVYARAIRERTLQGARSFPALTR
jgi:glycosyltransferase involved in cell wall biosynthesis